MSESWVFITADNTRYILHSAARPDIVVLQEEGTGVTDIEYITQRGPFQHGETVEGHYLRPRVIQLTLRHQYCNRHDYWCGRQKLFDMVRPNRGEGTLRKILRDGTKRDIKVYLQQGPSFPTREGWDEWAIQETVRFIAYDPLFFNPIVQTITYSPLSTPPLVFPITFPITFLATSLTTLLNYVGNWSTYPTITILGPISDFRITNATTGEKIQLAYSLAAGRTITINLQYGNKTITLDDGTNLISYLSVDSDLAGFHLQPGNNTIIIYGLNVNFNTLVTLSWYDRYIGLAGVCP